MDTFLSLTATEWTGIYALLTAGLLLVAILAAWYAHRQWEGAREAAAEQRKAQVEAMRPYVTVTVEPGLTSIQLFDLLVRNIGQRPAEKVRIEIDPPPVRAREMDEEDIQMANMRMLNEPMALLAPGQEIRAFYDNILDRKEREDLPTQHVVKVAYEDTSGRAYRGTFTLDLLALRGLSQTQVGTIHTISKALKAMERTLSGSALLKQGRLEVRATTEGYRERQMRDEIEEHQNLKGHVKTLKVFTPSDPGLPGQEQRLAEEQERFQRRIEDEAVEPVLDQVRRARHAWAWARRNLREHRVRSEGPRGR